MPCGRPAARLPCRTMMAFALGLPASPSGLSSPWLFVETLPCGAPSPRSSPFFPNILILLTHPCPELPEPCAVPVEAEPVGAGVPGWGPWRGWSRGRRGVLGVSPFRGDACALAPSPLCFWVPLLGLVWGPRGPRGWALSRPERLPRLGRRLPPGTRCPASWRVAVACSMLGVGPEQPLSSLRGPAAGKGTE